MNAVEFVNVSKTYRMGQVLVNALCGIDLRIEEGEYVAIMGPSGSGKSTLLNLLGCLDKPTGGRYLLADEDVSVLTDDKLSDIRCRRIGFVFQSYNLISQLDVLENIELPMFYQRKSQEESKQRATKLAELVGLGERTTHKPSELSGGQQQRVAIARALANEPMILLADEPTGNLDSKSGMEILGILENLHKNGKTLIMVTHDLKVGKRAQRLVTLKDGKVDEDIRNYAV
jgi:putative ABC transport system ATP-binding protein